MDWVDVLNQKRKERGLTVKQLAEYTGVPYGTISKILNRQSKEPTFNSVCQICNAMGVSVDDLFPPQKETPPVEADGVSAEEVYAVLSDAGLIQPGQDLSDADLQFLTVIVHAVSDWFSSKQQGQTT